MPSGERRRLSCSKAELAREIGDEQLLVGHEMPERRRIADAGQKRGDGVSHRAEVAPGGFVVRGRCGELGADPAEHALEVGRLEGRHRPE